MLVFPGIGAEWPGWPGAAGDLTGLPGRGRVVRPRAGAVPRLVGARRAARCAGAPSLERMEVVEPASYAVSVALSALWRAAGVAPAAVLGYRLGEIPAARVCGGLSPADGARAVALWSRQQATLAGSGTMAITALSAGEAEARISRWADRLSVVGYSGPRATVVSGENDAIAELLAELTAGG
ncbi:acyltransferase domain-containing protein, partial [Saccharothrix sp. MB29]|nr:acyltransferase domain-containing protein [Saccharothrix sp. MB29]